MLPDIFPEIKFPSMVVILSSLSTTYTLAPDFDDVVFNIDGIPYFPPLGQKEIKANEEFKSLCYEKFYEAINQGYSIILLNNTPLTLQVLKEFREKPDKPNASDWFIVSFFHEDIDHVKNRVQVTDTEYLNPQVMLDVKFKDILSLSKFQFIKKVIIPYNFEITFEYLTSLFDK
jgi:hypothetical protein